ncbi:MAG: hypothetical protein FWD97_04400 [Defluviitaleaceae bacterium]|nr:hypothetical protein [Defluviitaleaceae bacterium]
MGIFSAYPVGSLRGTVEGHGFLGYDGVCHLATPTLWYRHACQLRFRLRFYWYDVRFDSTDSLLTPSDNLPDASTIAGNFIQSRRHEGYLLEPTNFLLTGTLITTNNTIFVLRVLSHLAYTQIPMANFRVWINFVLLAVAVVLLLLFIFFMTRESIQSK